MRILQSRLPPSLARSETKEFNTLLGQWRGRRYIQDELQSRGFMVPLLYQSMVASYCNVGNAERLEFYWDELARERISPGANSEERRFSEGAYRSEYLDELAKEKQSLPNLHLPPLHPCMREFMTQAQLDPGLHPKIIADLERAKDPEIALHKIDSDRWSGTKKGALAVFANLFGCAKFERSTDFHYHRQNQAGLVFNGYLEFGSRPDPVVVPLRLTISFAKGPVEVANILPDHIIPGFWNYYRFDSLKSGVLGFMAHVQFLEVLSTSFA
jgi:hypothetical protein